MRERLRVRELTNDEGNRLLRTVRRSAGSVVTWRRSQMILLSAQGMDVTQIAKAAFTSADRVRGLTQLQRRQFRLAAPALRRGPATDVHPG